MAQSHMGAAVNGTAVGSILTRIIKYLIFAFLRSGKEAQRGVEFRHSTRRASRIGREVGNGSVLMRTECRKSEH